MTKLFLTLVMLLFFLGQTPVSGLPARGTGHATATATEQNDSLQKKSFDRNQKKSKKKNRVPRWSFGIFYVPYYSGPVYHFSSNASGDYFNYLETNSFTRMDGQFSFRFFKQWFLTLDVGYNAKSFHRQNEEHYRYTTGNNADTGFLTEEQLRLFDVSLGVKYYLKKRSKRRVSPYLFTGIGRQFAFGYFKAEYLYPPDYTLPTLEDNHDDYLKDLNSPWHVHLGFGAEYLFNRSLTIFAAIRFYYSRIDAKYDYRVISESGIHSGLREFRDSQFITHIGLGLNFYF